MKSPTSLTIAGTIATILTASSGLAADLTVEQAVNRPSPVLPSTSALRRPAHIPALTAAPEPATTSAPNEGFRTQSAFAAATTPVPDASNLSPPVTITYSGSSPVLQINNSGTNKGVYSNTTNASNASSALFGQTNGSGAGLTGYNSGTVGPAGKFAITNSSSSQSSVTTTTNGLGSALLGTITTPKSNTAALWGQNLVTAGWGIGVEGDGNWIGTLGYSAAGDGLYGESDSGYAVVARSTTGVGVYAEGGTNSIYAVNSANGDVIYVEQVDSGDGIDVTVSRGKGIDVQSATGTAILGHATSGVGLDIASDSGYAIDARSTNSYAIRAHDFGSGVGVYGTSATGYAGYFDGTVAATSFQTTSDRNAKTNIKAIDGKAILEKVSNLPVSSWVFKTDPQKSHMGPMAQEFHAAFGLDGDDDKHINLTDIAGVSLAAIQELNNQMQQKDAEIAALKQQLKAMNDALAARMTALERQQPRLAGALQTASLTNDTGAAGE